MQHPNAVSNVAELRSLIQSKFSPEYTRKMLHLVPTWPSIKDRASYLAENCKDKVVLDIGCTGALSAGIKKAARIYYGVDNQAGAWTVVDLDAEPEKLPEFSNVEVIVASEVLEHLANPGKFLAELIKKYPKTETFITVPNAGAYTVYNGCEMVNKDHVAWYSYTTLSTLLDRYGYMLLDCCWYNGQPHKAEGIIMKVIGAS